MANKRDNPATLTAIKNCIGKTVSKISRVQYYFNEIEDSDGFGDLELYFADNTFLTLTGTGDAESMKAINEKAIIPGTFNINGNDVCSWKRFNLSGDPQWSKIIDQVLNYIEIEWNTHIDGQMKIVACLLQFDIDFVTFYETGSDSNKFFINTELPRVDRETKFEKIIQ